MNKSIFAVLSIVCTAGIAQGGPVHFTFDGGGLASGNGDIKISQYMSSLYPSWVLVNGAEVHTGAGFSSDLYLWTRLQLLNPGKSGFSWVSRPYPSPLTGISSMLPAALISPSPPTTG